MGKTVLTALLHTGSTYNLIKDSLLKFVEYEYGAYETLLLRGFGSSGRCNEDGRRARTGFS